MATLTDLATNAVSMITVVSPAIALAWAKISAKFKTCEDDRKALSIRISALEVAQSGDVPNWVRNAEKQFEYVSPEFVRAFGAPRGLTVASFLGKKLSEIDGFSPDLLRDLDGLDTLALHNRYACKSGVEISPGVTATIIKTIRMDTSGSVIYVGYACPE